jgi:NADH dehydrogenase FAD-containing subunit
VTKKRILILGGGFGGVYVAVHLGKMLSQRELDETEIALVNRENYIVFQPLLPEVISGSVELNHVIAPIRRMAPRANLYTRDIESIRSHRAYGNVESGHSANTPHLKLRSSRDRHGDPARLFEDSGHA